MKRILGSLALAATLLQPLAFAEKHHRYYDKERHDWHEWTEGENRAYRHWLMEERREHQYREYNRLNAQRQREYWMWRHDHSDWH